MKDIHLKLLSAASLFSLTVMTMPDAEALTNIANGQTVTAPPQTNDVMNFQPPAPGGTFIIESGTTFTGALTTTNPGIPTGTLVLNTASQLNGAVGNLSNPLLQVNLNGNATIVGATSAATFNLGQNTLTNTGALNLPSGIILNTRVVTNALFGNIAIGGATDSIAGPSITVNVDASGVIALTPGAPLFVISAGAGTSALPVTVTSNNVLYSFIGNNLNGNVTIIPTLNPALPIPPGVGSIIADLLTIAANNPGSDIATVVAALSALPNAAAIAAALLQFNPIVDNALPRMSFEAAQQFQQLWALHMTNGRCIYAQECDECCDIPCCTDADCDCDSVCNYWEVWADGFGFWGHQQKHHGFNNYSSDLYGGMVGFQGPITQELSAGLGGGYAHTKVDRPRHNDSTINTYNGTIYLSYNPTYWYLDAVFSFDYNKYEDERHIKFPGIDRKARADYGGQQYTGLLAAGYRFYSWCYIFTPLASLQYSHLNVNRYHEHGAGDLDLHVKNQHYNFLESSLGLKVARPIQTTSGVFIPEVHALWLHDFFTDKMDLSTTFSGVAAAAGSFKTKGPGFPRNLGDVGAGITFISCIDLGIEGVYNYQFGERWHAHEALVKIFQRF